MNSQNTLRRIAAWIAPAALALLTTLPAQQQSPFRTAADENPADLLAPQSSGFAQKFGIKDVVGQLRLYGRVGLDTAGSGDANFAEQIDDENKGKGIARFAAVGGLAADIDFLGALREAAAVEIKYEQGLTGSTRRRSDAVGSRAESDERNGVSKVVRVCGFTIRADNGQSPSGAIQDGSNKSNGKFGPKELLPGGVCVQLMVGPVPLLIRANAGVGVELGASPFEGIESARGAHSVRKGLEGTVGAYINGWVTAGVGAGCRFASVCAGVKADLRLASVSAGLRLGRCEIDGFFAGLGFKWQAAALALKAIAYCELRIGWAKISKSFEYLLWQWSSPEKVRLL